MIQPFKKMKKQIILLATMAACIINVSFNKSNNEKPAETYMVTTLAGYSDHGTLKDGASDKACFGKAVGRSATDADGNLYVLDNNCLRKISPDGRVTTLLGEYVYDAEGNPVEIPKLGFANAVCIDRSGTIYISSGNNNSIKKVVDGKTLEVYAGTDGYKGSDDGEAKKAEFSNPQGICMDKSGNMYVADAYNYKVRKIAADGKTVTTLAGKGEVDAFTQGTGKTAGFREFREIVADSKGNIFITQDNAPTGSAIIKITAAGVVSIFAGALNRVPGEGKDGTGKAADFLRINALAIDADDNIYVGENYRVRKITPAGVVTTIAGSNEPQWRDAVGAKARFGMINGLSTDSKGNIFAGDLYCVRKISKQ
ncbi:MAG: hypothetical protein HOP10_01435 [Chitinophagaceae bacterium]|nr:hypothetical protein [Chitinophagaceae bacterium]